MKQYLSLLLFCTFLITSLVVKNLTLFHPLQKISEFSQNEEIAKKLRGPAIASLVTNDENDIIDLCTALNSLKNLPDNSSAPALIFNEDNLFPSQIELLRNCTPRELFFPLVNFSIFPRGFDPNNSTSNWSRRSKWGYHQMINFWISNIWEHVAITPYDTIMRIDSDSCWSQRVQMDGPRRYLPGLPQGKVYYANQLMYDEPFVTERFFEFTRDYIANNNLTVMNPDLLQTHRNLDNLTRITYNNFEVASVDFMLRPEVRKWHDQITNKAPFYVYKYRWGDAIERFATMAIFMAPSEVAGDMGIIPEYRHSTVCEIN